ncbi:MAG TPA: short-chain dehydrogenase [Planctomycetaceae bacterium]|nr:short-chain dehydrogenase [Planctomycetaceae bacterium]
MSIDKMFDLSGKVALVTGAAGSLGSAIATVYADAGADLLLVDIDGDGLCRLAKELEGAGHRVCTFVGSVGDIRQVTEMFELLDREFGKIDILVNVAGPTKCSKPEEVDFADVEYSMHHIATARFFCCQQAGKRMLAACKGSIISICSVTGITANGRSHMAYSMGMAAVGQMTRELSTEWSGRGVRVNAIVCGQITNKSLEQRMEEDPRLRKNFLRGIPMGRLGVNDDIKGIALLLASDASSFITGALIPLDGGNLAKNAGGSHPGMPEF